MDKTALVTGAAKGIGKAVALELASAGCRVAVHYNLSKREAEETVNEIRAAGGTAIALQADLRDKSQVNIMAGSLLSLWGCPDIIVNNAGIASVSMIQDVTAESWDNMMDSNLKSAFLVIKAFLPFMIDRHRGSIINISSMWGQVGGSCESVYSASKGGLISFTKALAKELGPSGIRVNCVAPGCIDTDMMASFSEETKRDLAEETPLGRIGRPEEVAKAVAFFASDASSFITGQVLGVNGGMVI